MFVVTVFLSLVAGISAHSWVPRASAASEAQIRFAIENKYDSTGPGAKTPEYAYKTYRTLDEALLAYSNDPDTQLPEQEKQRVLNKLTWPKYNSIVDVPPVPRYQPKTVDEYTGYKRQIIRNLNLPKPIEQNNIVTDYTGWIPSQQVGPKKPFNNFGYYKQLTNISPRPQNSYGFEKIHSQNLDENENLSQFQKIHTENLENENLSHLTQSDDFDHNPQYSFSYGVHDKGTGDSKSAHETRDGGTVRGYYTFMDADGKQRTVHYTADDKLGFRANVQRTHINTQ